MALTKVIGAGLGATQEGAITFNEGSADVDFRVESNGNTHGIFLDAGAGLVGIGNSNPDAFYNLADDLVIGNGSGGRGLTIYSGNDSSGYIGFNDAEADGMRAYLQYGHNDDTFRIGVAGESHFAINSAHILTMDKQPAFLAQAATQNNIALDTAVTVTYSNEHFDQNADYNNSTYIFTAPVTGRYQFNVDLLLQNLDSAAVYYQTQFTTSNRTYYNTLDPDFGQDSAYMNLNVNVLADMDASDTAKVVIYQNSGTQQTDVNSVSTFSGYLVC